MINDRDVKRYEIMTVEELRDFVKEKRIKNGETYGPPTSTETKHLLDFIEEMILFHELNIISIDEQENPNG